MDWKKAEKHLENCEKAYKSVGFMRCTVRIDEELIAKAIARTVFVTASGVYVLSLCG